MNLTVAVMIVAAMVCWSATVFAQSTQPRWFERPQEPRRPTTNPDAKKLPLIRVQGNHFVDPDGKTMLFRGVSIADPDVLEHQGHWNKQLFEQVKQLGANVVRLPVHPAAWR